MTVADFLAFTKRHWLLLLVTVIVGVLAGGAYWMLAPKTYEATASGFVAVEGSNVFGGTDATMNRARSYLPLITSTPVRERIAETAGVPMDSLGGGLSAWVPEGSTLINVTATSGDPEAARILASGALVALGDVITEIETQVAPDDGSGTLVVMPMENAVTPTSPVSPDLKLSLGIGALAGLVVGYAIAAVRLITDVRVRTGADLQALTGSGLLGRIPRVGVRRGEDSLIEQAGEALRQIRTGLRFASVDSKVRSIVITSAHQGEGKTTIAVALGRMIARGGENAIVVDADLRRPRVAAEMGIDGTVGLSQVLSGQAALADVLQATSDSHLFVLPAGGIPPNPSEMLGSEAMKALLQELARYGTIIIDAPPVLPVTDALLLGAAADGLVVIASAGKTHKTDVQATRALLEQARVRVLGCILNRVPAREAADGYSYKRQYKSYYADLKPDAAPAPGPARTPAPVAPAPTAPAPAASAPAPAPAAPTPAPAPAAPAAAAYDEDVAWDSLLSDSPAQAAPVTARAGRRRTP